MIKYNMISLLLFEAGYRVATFFNYYKFDFNSS